MPLPANRLSRLQGDVLDAVRRAGQHGRTCDELEVELGLSHQTCSARVYELARRGWLIASGAKRLTRSQRLAVVWVTARALKLKPVAGDRRGRREAVLPRLRFGSAKRA
jgi:DNA-binding Lrp family transcriptional regulator